MSYWAEIDKNNKVIRVTVGNDNDSNGDKGYQWLIDNLGGTWIETSLDGLMRKNYANIGYTYDAARDAFIAPKPFNSWVLDEATCQWQAPTPMPTTEGKFYYWSEDDLSWREITND